MTPHGSKVTEIKSGALQWKGGRLTMWGEWNEPGMREAYDTSIARKIDPVVMLKTVGIDFDVGLELVDGPPQ